MAERGKLRIYLGAAPGVGKTYDMLNEGHRLRARGTDVVVGMVETHGRAETEAQVRDLEIVPRREATHRGVRFVELDLDAVMARKPAVALVDELAHTNIPGSRNDKRWQDVEELLTAGIDVIGTLNVQHLESVNDVVTGITGIKQRETIPDGWVRTAEQIELVDLPPEALRRRLAYGNVYAADKVDAALRNYFRPGNLAALREIALLWVADRVDEALQRYRAEQGIVGEWETRERVLVALTGDEGADLTIRRAARIAGRGRGQLIGVYVRTSDGLAEQQPPRLEEHRRLLEDVGGSYHETVGSDVPTALLQVARAENVSQIVLGASRRSRVAELLRGSVINAVIRDSGAIDVHVVSRPPRAPSAAAAAPRRRRRPLAAVSLRRQLLAAAVALVSLPALTALLTARRGELGLSTTLLLYLLVAVGVATIGGLAAATLAAVSAFLLATYYLTEPYGSLTIFDADELLSLAAFLLVSTVVSVLVDYSARRAQEAARARTEAEALARVTARSDDDDPLVSVLEGLRSAFDLAAVALLSRGERGAWQVEAAAGLPAPQRPEDADERFFVSEGVALAMAGRRLAAEDRRLLSAYASQVSAARTTRELQAQASRAADLAEVNELRTALLSAVSHDLRTPLSTIKASVTSLLDREVQWPAAEEQRFLRTIAAETDRLNRLIGNLLDMSRITADAVDALVVPVGLDEVVPLALSGLESYDAAVVTDVPESLPLVMADPALLERAVANVVDNALRHSPPDGKVRVVADRAGGEVELRVMDSGAGIPEHERERVFQPFQRLGDTRAGGAGLGLAIARGFVEAMDGSLVLDDTPGGGTTVVIRLRRRG